MKKISVITLVILFILSGIKLQGQISTEESPISFSLDIISESDIKDVKLLPAFDLDAICQEDKVDEQNGIPPRFGYRHSVNYNLTNSGTWTTLSNGDKIWQLEIYSPGALSINLLYDKFWLPEGTKFFVYSSNRKHSIGAFTSVNNKGNTKNIQGFATGLIYGDKVILEYYLPQNVEVQGVISIAYVVHGYRYIVLPESTEAGYGESGSCQVNVNCSEGQNWQNEKNAVALILVDGNRYCSGSLINTTANDARPLFLTADHCLGGWANDYVKYDALTDSVLNHWSFYWHYESPGCTNSIPSIKSTSGAIVVANNSDSDFALLRLSEDPKMKTGITTYYLGWDRSGSAGTGGVGIHHPSGDVKKISTHNITPSSSNCFTGTTNNNFWKINWMQTQMDILLQRVVLPVHRY
jgi:hypothetical protein